VKLRAAPIITMLGVTAVVVVLIIVIHTALTSLFNYENLMKTSSWVFAMLVHLPQFLIPFLIMVFITRGKLSTYGYNLKQKPPFTHWRMLGLGVLFGLFMSFKYISQIVKNVPLDIPQPVTTAHVIGTMAFQWIVVGLSEETMFRGLIQTYLMNNLDGSVKILGHDLHIGTVIGAIFWGLFHFINILIMPFKPVLFFVILTTAIGLLMGYAYQRTGSLLTTIIVHNTIFGVPLTIGYILYFIR
jgi:membrane protease YdiL (CAAX protease family)